MPTAPEQLLRRSFRLAGHRTSVSLERAFWDELKALARDDGRTVTALLTEIDAGREVALSRAVRVYVLARLKARMAAGPAPSAAS